MTSGPDAGLRSTLKKHLTPLGFEITPMETGAVTAGVPDLYWRYREKQERGWIECKATKGWSVTLRPHQVGFCVREAQAGGRVAIAVLALGVGSGGPSGSALWLVKGSAAGRLAEPGGLRVLPADDLLGYWQGAPRMWDFIAIREILFKS